MSSYEVGFIDRQEITHEFVCVDKFKYSPNRGYKTVQKFCFRILGKIGCFANDLTTSINKVVITPDKFMERLFKKGLHILDQYHYKGKYLLLGPNEFNELMDQCYDKTQLFSFSTEYHNNAQLFNMQVIVIPWMTGILVLPKLKEVV